MNYLFSSSIVFGSWNILQFNCFQASLLQQNAALLGSNFNERLLRHCTEILTDAWERAQILVGYFFADQFWNSYLLGS